MSPQPTLHPVIVTDRLHPKSHILFWQYQGSATYIIDEQRLGTQAGQALWMPANSHHDIHVNTDSILLRIFFPAEIVTIKPKMQHPNTFQVDKELAHLLMGLLQSDSSLVQRRGILEQFALNKISEQFRDLPTPQNSAAFKIAEILSHNPGDPRTLDELAELVHASPRTIERAFINDTGTTFQDWRLQSRIAKAKQLLAEGIPINTVALRVGYSTPSAFGRAFKRHTGMPPGCFAS